VYLQAIDFLNATGGWVVLDEYTGPIPRKARAKTEIWSTDNRGRAWHVTYISPGYNAYWWSQLHNSICWRTALSRSSTGGRPR
jgi:hypothetical protein